VGQASDFGQACCRQLLHRGIRPVGPHDRRRGPGIEADSAESLAGRAQRLPGEDQVIDQVNWRAGRQSLSGEPTPADRRVLSVRDEISLGNPPDENRGHAESQRHGAGQRPGSLIAPGDRVARRNGPGKLPGDEGEVGRAPQDALEVGEAPPPGPSFPVKDLEVTADAAQHDVRDRGRVHNPQLPNWLLSAHI
jgi:hypothetical protein